jgi:hypothetical protein
MALNDNGGLSDAAVSHEQPHETMTHRNFTRLS